MNRIWVFCGLLLAMVGMNGYSQGVYVTLPLNGKIDSTLPAGENLLYYTVTLQKGTFFEVIFNTYYRDDVLQMQLIDDQNNEIGYNESMNYPNFLGAYLNVTVPETGKYYLIVYVGKDESEEFPYQLINHVYQGDEEEYREIETYDVLDGVIAPDSDADLFLVSLRKDNPVLFVVTTPYNVLDSIIGIFDSTGELVTYNDDFYGTNSTLLFIPESNGVYTLAVQGKYVDSVGPYQLIMNPVPLQTPPFSLTAQIDTPGEMMAYRVSLKAGQVYNFYAFSVDDFNPYLVLSDGDLNVYASDLATTDYPAAVIQGYAPVEDQILYLFVMGDYIDVTGYFGLDCEFYEDETDGVELEHGDYYQGAIGPIGDVDEYVFTAAKGMDYSILVTPTQFYLDPAIRVLDMVGNVVYSNDDSADGLFSLLSGIAFPEAATYRIQVMGSPVQTNSLRLTGVYLIQFATGTTFDWGAPRLAEELVSVTSTASGVHISIPTSAIADDTYPLSATFTLDQSGNDVLFTVEKGVPVELDFAALPDEVFFLTLTDSAAKHNSEGPVTIPAPRILSDLEGMPNALAVDRNNQLYLVDSEIGGIVKYSIHGASEVILRGELTQGGTYGPNALAFDLEGTLFYTNAASQSVVKILPSGATETVVSGLNFPVAMIFDKEGMLYIAQIGSDTVDQIDAEGNVVPRVSTIRNPTGLAFSSEGELYVCNSVEGKSRVYRIKEDGTAEIFADLGADSLHGMAFDRDGYLYVTDEDMGYLYRISPAGEAIVFTKYLGATGGLAFGYGEYAKTLFVSSGFYYEDPDREVYYYEQRLIAVPTGRVGIPVPDGETAVNDWMMF